MDLDFGQILTQIFGFLIMLWVLKRYGWKPLLNGMEERKQKIKDEFQAIEDQKREVQRLTDAYNEKINNIEAEARHIIQEAVKEGRQIGHEIQEESQRQAQEIVEKAKMEVNILVARGTQNLNDDIA